jgi:hypothetical protein
MKITLEKTSKLVELQTSTGIVPARIWEGTTESGVPIHAFITRIGVARHEDLTQFERELQEERPPSALIDATYPARMVL